MQPSIDSRAGQWQWCVDHKFLKSYINNHEVPRKVNVVQGTNFVSKEVKAFCNNERIEIIQSPVNDHRATGCVE